MLSSHNAYDEIDSQTPLPTDTIQDEPEQPTLAEILCAVHMCTASVNTLKDQFGGL